MSTTFSIVQARSADAASSNCGQKQLPLLHIRMEQGQVTDGAVHACMVRCRSHNLMVLLGCCAQYTESEVAGLFSL